MNTKLDKASIPDPPQRLSSSLSLSLSLHFLYGVVSTHPVLAASFLTFPVFAFWARQPIFSAKKRKSSERDAAHVTTTVAKH